jgi:hypothetical protein
VNNNDERDHAEEEYNKRTDREEYDEDLEVVPDVSMTEFTKMLDEAWPKGMPPESLEVCISGPDQVVHRVEKVTLEIFGDQETVVVHWKDDEDEVDAEQTP